MLATSLRDPKSHNASQKGDNYLTVPRMWYKLRTEPVLSSIEIQSIHSVTLPDFDRRFKYFVALTSDLASSAASDSYGYSSIVIKLN